MYSLFLLIFSISAFLWGIVGRTNVVCTYDFSYVLSIQQWANDEWFLRLLSIFVSYNYVELLLRNSFCCFFFFFCLCLQLYMPPRKIYGPYWARPDLRSFVAVNNFSDGAQPTVRNFNFIDGFIMPSGKNT